MLQITKLSCKITKISELIGKLASLYFKKRIKIENTLYKFR